MLRAIDKYRLTRDINLCLVELVKSENVLHVPTNTLIMEGIESYFALGNNYERYLNSPLETSQNLVGFLNTYKLTKLCFVSLN